MRAGIVKRLIRLEANKPSLTLADKNAAFRQKALEVTSDGDLDLLEEIALLQASGRHAECSVDQLGAAQRYDEAYVKAISESNVKFTVSEIDQILGAE